jgi:hypothetical protein
MMMMYSIRNFIYAQQIFVFVLFIPGCFFQLNILFIHSFNFENFFS